jgi:HAD superfamily hydrolase (TIGR01549 family)
VTGGAWVCLDIGEVLIDETRIWSTWADALGLPRFTFLATMGGAIAAGGDHREAFAALGVHDWADREAAVQATYGGFVAEDLYPDALPAIAAMRTAGLRVAVVGNQPARRHAELLALGLEVDLLAMSDALGVEKPSPAFFARILSLLGAADPATVAYVGDRVDNDVVPAAAAGLRAVWLRRGPWGILHRDTTGAASITTASLREVAAQVPALLRGPGAADGARP